MVDCCLYSSYLFKENDNFCLLFSDVSRLKTNIIQEFKESTYALCAHHCAAHRFCVATNYKRNDRKGPNCQLTNTTKPKFEENAEKKDKIWVFQKVNADRSMLVSIFIKRFGSVML